MELRGCLEGAASAVLGRRGFVTRASHGGCVAVDAAVELLAARSGAGLTVWSVHDRAVRWTHTMATRTASRMAFVEGGPRLVCVTDAGVWRVDLEEGREVQLVEAAPESVHVAANGRFVAAPSAGGGVAVVDVVTLERWETPKLKRAMSGAPSVSDDGARVCALVGRSGVVYARDQAKPVFQSGLGFVPEGGALSPDGRLMWARSKDLVSVWDVAAQECLWRRHTGKRRLSFAFSADSATLWRIFFGSMTPIHARTEREGEAVEAPRGWSIQRVVAGWAVETNSSDRVIRLRHLKRGVVVPGVVSPWRTARALQALERGDWETLHTHAPDSDAKHDARRAKAWRAWFDIDGTTRAANPKVPRGAWRIVEGAAPSFERWWLTRSHRMVWGPKHNTLVVREGQWLIAGRATSLKRAWQRHFPNPIVHHGWYRSARKLVVLTHRTANTTTYLHIVNAKDGALVGERRRFKGRFTRAMPSRDGDALVLLGASGLVRCAIKTLEPVEERAFAHRGEPLAVARERAWVLFGNGNVWDVEAGALVSRLEAFPTHNPRRQTGNRHGLVCGGLLATRFEAGACVVWDVRSGAEVGRGEVVYDEESPTARVHRMTDRHIWVDRGTGVLDVVRLNGLERLVRPKEAPDPARFAAFEAAAAMPPGAAWRAACRASDASDVWLKAPQEALAFMAERGLRGPVPQRWKWVLGRGESCPAARSADALGVDLGHPALDTQAWVRLVGSGELSGVERVEVVGTGDEDAGRALLEALVEAPMMGQLTALRLRAVGCHPKLIERLLRANPKLDTASQRALRAQLKAEVSA